VNSKTSWFTPYKGTLGRGRKGKADEGRAEKVGGDLLFSLLLGRRPKGLVGEPDLARCRGNFKDFLESSVLKGGVISIRKKAKKEEDVNSLI